MTEGIDFLAERAAWAEAARIPRQRILVDAALDLGKTATTPAELLFENGELAALGYATFLSASNKGFLGHITGAEVADRNPATHAAHVVGIMQGALVLRAHDVKSTRRVTDTMSELLQRGGVQAPQVVAVK